MEVHIIHHKSWQKRTQHGFLTCVHSDHVWWPKCPWSKERNGESVKIWKESDCIDVWQWDIISTGTHVRRFKIDIQNNIIRWCNNIKHSLTRHSRSGRLPKLISCLFFQLLFGGTFDYGVIKLRAEIMQLGTEAWQELSCKDDVDKR